MEKLVKQIKDFFQTDHTIMWPQNWVIKLLSLCFAIFLWYFVVGEDKVDMSVLIPIEVVNLPHDLVISNQYKKQLEVSVRGPRELIRGITRQNISRTIDLSNAKPGTVVIQNNPESLTLPRGIGILRIQPPSITLLLDELVHKTLEIKPVINGTPAKGYELKRVTLEPSSIEITGPKELLGPETFLQTVPIDITTMKENGTKQVSLDLKPEIADMIGESVVSVHISITEKHTEKKLTLPINVPETTKKQLAYIITPESVEISAQIPLSLAQGDTPLESYLKPTIENIDNLPVGKHELPVIIKPPKGIEIEEIKPATIKLEIVPIKEPQKTKKTISTTQEP